MKLMLRAVAIVIFFAVFAHADETLRDFTFTTVNGQTIEYKAADKSPLVVNIGAYW